MSMRAIHAWRIPALIAGIAMVAGNAFACERSVKERVPLLFLLTFATESFGPFCCNLFLGKAAKILCCCSGRFT